VIVYYSRRETTDAEDRMAEPLSLAVPAPPKAALSWRAVLRVVRDNPLQLWTEEAYDSAIERQSFLGRPRLLLNAPEAIQHVLIGNAENYRRTAPSIRLLRPFVGRGLLLSEGELWRRQRRLIAPTLAPRALPPLMRHAATAVATWRDRLAPEIDLCAEMQALALEIAGRAMFSVGMAPFAAEMRGLLTQAGIALSRPDFLDLVLPIWLPSPRDFARWRFQRRWMGLMTRVIAAREHAPAARETPDLFDLLRAASAPDGKAGMRQLRDEVATMIIAGHETTALTLFWAGLLLATAPAVQARIAEEARGLDLGPDGIAEALGRLEYTRAVVSEALRLYPPAATIVREAIAEDRCGDLVIPRGALVMIAPWVLHRHRQLWDAPERFDPDRFLPGAPLIPRFAYLPFGAGPRVCVGAQFALAEATLVLATLVRDFVLERADAAPVFPVSVVTTQPNRPVSFLLSPRRGK